MSSSAIPRDLRASVRLRDGGRCQYCRLVQVGQGATLHINHVVPRSRGGPTLMENLVVQCPSRSLHKADKTAARDDQTGQDTPLFHPLQQRWDEHFTLAADGSCVGITPTGRATVFARRMNEPLPKTARAIQLSMKLI